MGSSGLESDRGGGAEWYLQKHSSGRRGYRSPAAGLSGAGLELSAPKEPNIPIEASAQLDPSMLAPKAEAPNGGKPDPVMDPAWYAAENKGSTDIQDILSSYGYAFGGAAKEPTEAQKKAGNYRKGHIRFNGLDISVENPKGSVRRGKDASGKSWSCVMPADYGYVKQTEGADGDHVDVFIGPHPTSHVVFIINQNDHRTGKFDEHKAMLGYRSEKEACADYCKAFSDGKGMARIGSIETVSIDAFKKWLKSGKVRKAAKSKSIVDHALKHVMAHT